MSTLATEVEETLSQLDPATSESFQRLVRDAMALAKARPAAKVDGNGQSHKEWIAELRQIRASVQVAKSGGPTTEEILDDLRADRF